MSFSVDGTRVFVGSLNFHPRSARLNTELSFVIESEPLASEIAKTFNNDVPANSYEVRLDDQGHVLARMER